MTINFLTMGATEYNKFYDWVELHYPGPHLYWECFASEFMELHEWLKQEHYYIIDDYVAHCNTVENHPLSVSLPPPANSPK